MRKQQFDLLFGWFFSPFPAFFALFLFFIFPKDGVYAQSKNPILENISLEEGLKQAMVYAIAQDDKGRIWVATLYGLYSYNGYQFIAYLHDSEDKNSISDNHIYALYADPVGSIWAASRKNGLHHFDTKTGQFTHYFHDKNNSDSLSSNRLDIGTLYPDKDGTLWVGTKGGGLNHFDPQSEKFKRFQHLAKDPDSLSGNRVRSLLIDRQGTVWVGTGKSGLNRLDKGTGKFQRYQSDPFNPHSLQGGRVRTIYEDQTGQLWIGTEAGLNLFHQERNQFELFPVFDAEIANKRIGVEVVYEDSAGTLWIGHEAGLGWLDRQSKRVIHFPLEKFKGRVFSLFEDRSGVLWIGTDGGGIFKYARRRNQFISYPYDPDNSHSLSHPNIRDVYETSEGILWVATKKGGVNRIDRQTGKIEYFKRNPNDSDSLAADRVECILEDEKGIIWLGTANGLNRYDPKSKEIDWFQPFPEAKDLEDNWIDDLHLDQEGRFWVATDFGLAQFDRKTGHFQLFAPETENSRKKDMMGIYEEPSGQLWVMTKAGIFQFDPLTRAFHPFPPGPNHSLHHFKVKHASLYRDQNGMLWAATVGGLFGIDWKKQQFVHLTEKQGLPTTPAYSVIGDHEGNLWIGTSLGLVRYNLQTKRIKTYSVPNGLLGQDFNSVAFVNSQGELFVGSTEGLNSFFPKQLEDNPHQPPIILTSFIGIAQSLVEGVTGALPEKARSNLSLIISNGERLSHLVNDLLDFSKMKNRDLTLQRRSVDLHSAVDLILALFTPLIGEKSIVLVNQIPSTLPVVYADENRLEQILHNLIGNAVKFTNRGEITITAREESRMIHVSVSDTGIGISEERHDQIFQSFEQFVIAIQMICK